MTHLLDRQSLFFPQIYEVIVSENWEVLAFVSDGASTIVSLETLTSVGVLSSIELREFSLIL